MKSKSSKPVPNKLVPKKAVPNKAVSKHPTRRKNGNASLPNSNFLVVAIGASAGGLEALKGLLRHIPPDTGLAFVFVQHLDPKHHSLLTELLARETPLPVVQIENGMEAKPDHVFVIPPNVSMTIQKHTFQLMPRDEMPGLHMTVDHFMRSLAETEGLRSIGVILSGTGSDGTLGLAEIQAQGGVTFAQEETSAKFDGMPRSAIAAGHVDFVLPPAGIAKELVRIARHPYAIPSSLENDPALARFDHGGINSIFLLLRKSTGVDFTYYRHSTIRRRIQRRMMLHKIDKLDEYIRMLQQSPAELRSLYHDILINVTSFFRNPKVFEAIKKLFPKILKRHPDVSLRIWAPGCSSGEEVYSLAMVLLEILGDRTNSVQIQLFGTDVSESSIRKARAGFYPDNIQADVSPLRLRRFFVKAEGGYRVSKHIRDMCIFAEHNVLSDPPFSQMDLVCCRNLLIYLEPVLQKRAISLFHYALRPTGYLVLGSSEGLGLTKNLFGVEDRVSKIYSRKMPAARPEITFSLHKQPEGPQPGVAARFSARTVDMNPNVADAQREFDRQLLAKFTPAAVFINQEMELVHSRGGIDKYLKLAPGRASLGLFKMVREGLLSDLRNAIRRAQKENITVRKQGVELKDDQARRIIDFEVLPVIVPNAKESFFMITFTEAVPKKTQKQLGGSHGKRESLPGKTKAVISKLEQELAANKEYLYSLVEAQEVTNEELQSSNEEILSSNEELQSTNEEVETAKEELQSSNEELTTVNEELRNRNLEITQSNNDLMNLLTSINLPVVMLANDLTIRRITPQAQTVLGILATDIGRPISNINPNIEIPDLLTWIQQVLADLKTVEKEIVDRSGKWFLLRILPYRAENRIEGVVITLIDIPSAEPVRSGSLRVQH